MANAWGDVFTSLSQSLPQVGQAYDTAVNEDYKRKRQAKQDIEDDKKANIASQLAQMQLTQAQNSLNDEADKKTKAQEWNQKLQDILGKYQDAQTNRTAATEFDQQHAPNMPVDEGQKIDLAQQAMKKYPSLGNLPGQSVMQKTNITPELAQKTGYSVPEATPPEGVDLEQGRALKAKNRVDTLNSVGGMSLNGNQYVPQGDNIYKTFEGQDKADQDAANKKLEYETSHQNRQDMIDAENQRAKEHNETMLALGAERNKGGSFTVDDIKSGDASDQIANKIAKGEITFDQFTKIYPGFSKNAVKREAILERVMQINPDFNAAQSMLEYKWGANPGATKTVAAANNAMANIDKLTDLSDQWKRSGSPAFNRLLKEGQFQVGNKIVSNIKEMQIAVGDEVAGVLGYGGASDLKTKLGLELTDANVSPEVFQSNMKVLKHMLETRRQTMAAPMGAYANRPGVASVLNNQTSSPATTKIGRFQVQVH